MRHKHEEHKINSKHISTYVSSFLPTMIHIKYSTKLSPSNSICEEQEQRAIPTNRGPLILISYSTMT